jgi:hypothetical protein
MGQFNLHGLGISLGADQGRAWGAGDTLTKFGMFRPLPCISDCGADRKGSGGRGAGRADHGVGAAVGCRLVEFVANPCDR